MTTPVPAASGVVVVTWPSAGAAADRARARLVGAPCLLVVEEDAVPPTDCTVDEDWTPSNAPRRDVDARIATLAARPLPRPRLGAAVLGPLSDEAVMLLDLLDRRRPRAVATAAAADAIGRCHDLRRALRAVRAALRPAGYDVVAVRGGVVLAGVGDARCGPQRTR